MSDASKTNIEHIDDKHATGLHADEAFKHIAQGVNRKLVLLMMFSCVGAFTYGFSAAIVSSSLGQPRLFAYFELATKSNVTGIIGAIASLFNVGGFFGVFLASFVSNRWGRKFGFGISSLAAFLGAGLAAGSINLPMLIMGRFFTGVGAWGFMLASICYTQELSPATQRGALGGSVGVALMCGYITAAWVGYGFYFYDSPSNWRVPFALQIVSPLIVAICLPFIPESPRWLESRGRSEEALVVLKSVHKYSSDPDYVVAREEHYQIKVQTALEHKLATSWGSMFGKYLKRTLCAILVPAANQFTGANLLANFGPRLYASLGFSPAQALIFQAGWLMTGGSLAMFTILVVDRVGRVKLLVWSILGSATFIAIEAALAARIEITTAAGLAPNKAIQSAAVAMIFIWYLGYAFGEPVQFLYIGEIFPNHVRIKGTAIGLATINVMAVWVTVSQPTAQAAIGWKFWLVFIIPSAILGVVQWFVLPETKNVPLEEVGGLFGDTDDVAVYAADIFVDDKGEVVVGGHH